MGSRPSQFFNSEARKEKCTGLVSIKAKTMKTLFRVDLCIFMAFWIHLITGRVPQQFVPPKIPSLLRCPYPWFGLSPEKARFWVRGLGSFIMISWVWPPPMLVTTRIIIIFRKGYQPKPSFSHSYWEGSHTKTMVPFGAPEKDIGPGSNFNQYGRSSPAGFFRQRQVFGENRGIQLLKHHHSCSLNIFSSYHT